MAGKANTKTIAQNKKAFHDYFVEESFEAGIELKGTEVKSLRAGRANLKDAWCSVVNGEMVLNGCHISPYDFGNIFNPDHAAACLCTKRRSCGCNGIGYSRVFLIPCLCTSRTPG